MAQYPWKAASARALGEPPGVIVVTDTRVTVGDRPGTPLYAKQRLQSPNIVVCFTSSHGAATETALRGAYGKRSVRAIGEHLREAHLRFGGFTELLAVVWRGDLVPQILEVMPPTYQPISRTGVVGIGDGGVLSFFKAKAIDDPDKREGKTTPSPEMIAMMEEQFGYAYTEPAFTIDEAATLTAAAVAVGIAEAGGVTVALPLQAWTIQRGVVRNVSIAMSNKGDPTRVRSITTTSDKVGRPATASSSIARYSGPQRKAIQLLD